LQLRSKIFYHKGVLNLKINIHIQIILEKETKEKDFDYRKKK
jgi:hypothetical protein